MMGIPKNIEYSVYVMKTLWNGDGNVIEWPERLGNGDGELWNDIGEIGW